MTEITATLVKDLRERSGAGMMDCKKALNETNGNIDEAVDWLRKKGLAAAAKKSGRVAAEGLIAAIAEGQRGVMVEINSETDFVSRNEHFQGFARTAADLMLKIKGGIEELKAMIHPSGKTVEQELTALIATVGENMNLRRAASLSVDHGVVTSYVHAPLAPGLGKIGVLVALESTADTAKLASLGKQLAMHVAAARPEVMTIADVKPEWLDRERAVLMEQATAAGKTGTILEKMVEGRIRKYHEEIVLMEQVFVMDGETKISKVLENASVDAGTPIRLLDFVRYGLGEGIERERSDFAAEVAAQLDR
jgi:elongation factor Ts